MNTLALLLLLHAAQAGLALAWLRPPTRRTGLLLGAAAGLLLQAPLLGIAAWSVAGALRRHSWAGATLFLAVGGTLASQPAPWADLLLKLWLALGWGWSCGEPTRDLLRPVLPSRSPRAAALRGLVPGWGQSYNGEPGKAWILGSAGLFQLGIVALVAAFHQDPLALLAGLAEWGLLVSLSPDVFASLPIPPWPAPLLLALLCLLSAWDAARTAARRPGLPVGLTASYLAHLLVLALLVLVPLTAGAGAPADAALYDLTWVDTPRELEPWRPGSEGGGEGGGGPQAERRQGRQRAELGAREKPTATSAEPVLKGRPEASPGAVKSYNAYLSHRLHRLAHPWFVATRLRQWAVLSYRIEADGRVTDVRLVSGQGAALLDLMRAEARYAPLAPGVKALKVTELFWCPQLSHFPPGSQEARLSQLFDGRQIEVEK